MGFPHWEESVVGGKSQPLILRPYRIDHRFSLVPELLYFLIPLKIITTIVPLIGFRG